MSAPTRQIIWRVTPEEFEQIRALAAHTGDGSVAALLRNAVATLAEEHGVRLDFHERREWRSLCHTT